MPVPKAGIERRLGQLAHRMQKPGMLYQRARAMVSCTPRAPNFRRVPGRSEQPCG
jgi:hypothetical protein